MKKTFEKLVDVIDAKHELYANMPEEHLSEAGHEVRRMYAKLSYDACFTDAEGLLHFIDEDVEYNFKTDAARDELAKVQRYLKEVIG